MESFATKQQGYFNDGTKGPAWFITVVVPEQWLRYVVDIEGADQAAVFIGREALKAIKSIEPEGIGRG